MIELKQIKNYICLLLFFGFSVLSFNSFGKSYIDEASDYTVRFRVLVDHPFVEDTNDDEIIRSWVGAGFVVTTLM